MQLLIVATLFTFVLSAQEPQHTKCLPFSREASISYAEYTVLSNNVFDYIDLNQVKMMFSNNGIGSFNNSGSGSAGFYWPYKTNPNLTAVFMDGLVFAGKINGVVRAGGSYYRSGLQAGKILTSGIPDDPGKSEYRIYKIKKNWEQLPPGPLRNRYEADFNAWPVSQGAPFNDVNNNGVFDPGTDTPKFYCDETAFYVSNDMDSTLTLNLFGSQPMGLEIQTLIYASSNPKLQDVIFKRHRIINKGGNQITEMYLGYIIDSDVGNAVDDYSGCDSALHVSYTYNGDNFDDGSFGYGTNPPAVGHMIIQTPIVPGQASDTARFGDGWINGYRNIEFGSFAFYICGSSLYSCPSLGQYSGTLSLYNNMQGLTGQGLNYINPHSNQPTKYPLNGNPSTGSGWFEGQIGWPSGYYNPGDRGTLISSGPFNFAPGDTQEIVIAIFAARGNSNLLSIDQLKSNAIIYRNFYNSALISQIERQELIPDNFATIRNYPNPFNSVTKIEYTVPYRSDVRVRVFNVLGQLISEPVNRVHDAGTYIIDFNAGNLSGGIYKYLLEFDGHISTGKMVFLK